MSIYPVEDLIEDMKKGRVVILVDDEDRENEGDLVVAAEFVTPEIINFMAKYGRGLICLAITEEKAKQLDLKPIPAENGDGHLYTAFTVPISAKDCINGISAFDRARTISLAISDSASPNDFIRPGHVFPLVARRGGVLIRPGHTEGSVDLARLAGLKPAAVICEIMREDGYMARLSDLKKFAREHQLKIGLIADIIKFRLRSEKFVEKVAVAELPTIFGDFKIIAYENKIDNQHHVALVKGEIDPDDKILVRVHSECLTGDVFNSLRCDCGSKVYQALEMIGKEERGVFLYMRMENKDKGLIKKIRAYQLQDENINPVEGNFIFKTDFRDYGAGAQILADLGVRKMKLLTNNPKRMKCLEGFGLKIVEYIPMRKISSNLKKDVLGHFL